MLHLANRAYIKNTVSRAVLLVSLIFVPSPPLHSSCKKDHLVLLKRRKKKRKNKKATFFNEFVVGSSSYIHSAGGKETEFIDSSSMPERVRKKKERLKPIVKLCLIPELLFSSLVQKEEDNYHHLPAIWWPTGNNFVV